jgi:flavodoxin
VETLIVYKSYRYMNTEKVARAMAEVIEAQISKVEDVVPEALREFDLIGFGSGIYGSKHHNALIGLIEAMPAMEKDVFVFSTAGILRKTNHQVIREKLAEKGCHIVGEFACAGQFAGTLRLRRDWTVVGEFVGAMNKGHPNETDLDNARAFAKTLVNTQVTPSSELT